MTLRRPGCGVGSPIISDETDFKDPSSKRNTYAHWDSRFIRWLAQKSIHCHFYTNYDLDCFQVGQTNPLLKTSGQPAYTLLLSVGHDEYWSTAIRAAIEAYQQANGNIAIFSGNTSFRPVGFGAPSDTASKYDAPTVSIPADAKSIMIRLNGEWLDDRNEASTIGVTFKTGAGSWKQPPVPQRSQASYTFVPDWIIRDASNASFGSVDCIVGYECDALFPGHSPANFIVLANATLSGLAWTKEGKADMGYFQRIVQAPANRSILFNAATTDFRNAIEPKGHASGLLGESGFREWFGLIRKTREQENLELMQFEVMFFVLSLGPEHTTSRCIPITPPPVRGEFDG